MDWETLSLNVWVYKYNKKKYNTMISLKAKLCEYAVKNIFSGFIQTMQFIEKDRNLTLKGYWSFSCSLM